MKLKVISLNMWWGGNLLPAIIDFLKAEAADVVALQEVHNGTDLQLKDRQRSMQILHKQLGYPYNSFAEALRLSEPEGKIPSGNAVLSKYPVTGTKYNFLVEPTRTEYLDIPEQWPTFPRLLQQVEIKASNHTINVFNIHGIWDLAGDNYSLARQQMSQKIIRAITGKSNVILLGDTNAKRSNQAMKDLESQLKPVFGSELITTFNMHRKNNPGYATAAVDLMYVSPNIEIVSSVCSEVDISDHLPLVVTLQIPT